VSQSWFYKWRQRGPTPRQQRQARLVTAVKKSFDESDGDYGSPRVLADLRADGWRVSKKSVEASMARQRLVGRAARRRFRCLTRTDKAAALAPDLVKRDFSTGPVDQRWCGDLERHEALSNPAVVKGHRRVPVAAGALKLRAA
jgi:putative transposase